MNRDIFIKNITKDRIEMSPKGRNANELSVEEFEKSYENFFDMIFEIASTDISGLTGYGEFDENNTAPYATFREFVLETFDEEQEGYWHSWTQMFGTTFLKKDYFEKIYAKVLQYADFCEGQRYLVNNNTFFRNMLVDDAGKTYCADWGRAGIMDFLMDFAILDLNKPYLLVPEKLYEYAGKKNIEIKNFKERFLCMAYFKGIHTLMWHASIDDLESCESITVSLNALEERMNKLS
ncbi:MAG: aminoglycoside phosphotransferase family protein [Lachnospiraceae bacterium]|nr:aminoglycoside phosphotransferase family protein [Lachnospiraceae bacterium]